jgi:multidrug efflux pump subunit AcrB
VSRIIGWFVQNPVAANLLMCLLLLGGVMTLPQIPQEEFPNFDTKVIRVSVEYEGAAPEESEEGVCIRIEEELEGTQGVDDVTSLAVEGACVVTVELLMSADDAEVAAEIKNRVDGIDTFPVETKKPVVSNLLIRNEVLQVAVVGDGDERTLRVLGQRVRDEIVALPGVSQVSLEYVRPYEIAIEVPEEKLRQHGLTFDQVARAIRRSSLDMPGGSVKTAAGEVLLRAKGQAYAGADFEDTVILARSDGTRVTLLDVAQIIDAFEDTDLRARFNGRSAALVAVRQIGQEDIREIADTVTAYVEDAQRTLPDGIDLVVFNDESKHLEARLGVLLRNGVGGLVLVLLVLGLFLRFRLAMWVAAGVPIAFLGALSLFPTFGLTISTLSVMAFILVLGIVVDDAIVIGENVYSHEQRGETGERAAIDGTREVHVPVIFGVMTSVAAFLPLLLVSSRMGQFFRVLGTTAILCLMFSLIESQLILPAHLAHRRTSSKGSTPNPAVRVWRRLQGGLTGWLDRLAKVHYGNALRAALEWRYVTVAVAASILVLTVAMLASGRLRYQFMPGVEADTIHASLTMPQGTPLRTTEAAVDQMAAAADQLSAAVGWPNDGPPLIRHRLTTLGSHQNSSGGPPDTSVRTGGAHLAEISIELLPTAERNITTTTIESRWRELTGAIPGAVELSFSSEAFSMGDPVNIELKGGSIEMLTAAASAVKEELAGFSGISEISDSFRAGKQEIQISILAEAKPLGLRQDDLARQVRQAFYGEEVQRVQRGRDDVRVMLRYPEPERTSLGFLREMRIRTEEGTEVPFSSVAAAELGRGYASIRRRDRQRVVNVTSAVDRTVTTPESVLASMERKLPEILSAFPGVDYSLQGAEQEHSDAANGLFRGLLLALLIIYALLAIPLRSYTQPLIIMSVIPFGTVGAILGHAIMGWDVVFFSVLGMVALAGVVVNSSLVIVHFVNRKRDEGLPFMEAVSEAGVARFRPIVLTSVTTFVGLVPLMLEANPQATMLIPMAISLGYGVLFASAITLFLVPSLYVVLDDLRGARSQRLASAKAPPLGLGESA